MVAIIPRSSCESPFRIRSFKESWPNTTVVPMKNQAPLANKKRCTWSGTDPLFIAYHDEEWGVPLHDDRVLFEFLVLEGAQAGLSWSTILRKRDAYRRAFDRFDPRKVARYEKRKVAARSEEHTSELQSLAY